MATTLTPANNGLSVATQATDRWVALAILTALYTLNVADRFIVSTLMEPIKHEFALSDAMVGFLTGTVLALFFVVASYPAGLLSDRGNRKVVIAGFAVVFSLMTMACGRAMNFVQFAVARLGVGVAEAGPTPPSLSLLADKFPAARRPMAMTIFTIGSAWGGAVGSAGGGWLNDHYGWRSALVVFGLAGLPFVILVLTVIREPKRGIMDATPPPPSASIGKTLRFMWGQKALVHVMAGGAAATFCGWGLLWWAPPFFHRSFGMTVGHVGAMLGSMHLVVGSLGTLLVAVAMRWLGNRDARHQLALLAVLMSVATIPAVLTFASSSLAQSVTMMWFFVPTIYLYFGPNFGMINNLVPASMRGQAVAIYLIVTNFANLALAPPLVGWVSDFLMARGYDPASSLKTALIGLAVTCPWAGIHYLLAMRHVRQDLIRVSMPL